MQGYNPVTKTQPNEIVAAYAKEASGELKDIREKLYYEAVLSYPEYEINVYFNQKGEIQIHGRHKKDRAKSLKFTF